MALLTFFSLMFHLYQKLFCSRPVPFRSVSFRSSLLSPRPRLFCSVLFCSVPFCSVLFCSVLFCSVLFCSVLFYFILFYSRIHKHRSFHCDVCGVCLDVQLRDNHKCRAGSAHDECCICLEVDLAASLATNTPLR